MLDVADAGARMGHVLGLVVIGTAVVSAPFAIGGTALVGAMRAEPAAIVHEATKALVAAWDDLKPQEEVRNEVLRLAGANRTPYYFVLLPDPLARGGVDAVLEIDVPTMHLKAQGEINPASSSGSEPRGQRQRRHDRRAVQSRV